MSARALRGDAALKSMVIEFIDMVVNDGIDPKVAHAEFMKIHGYAEFISQYPDDNV